MSSICAYFQMLTCFSCAMVTLIYVAKMALYKSAMVNNCAYNLQLLEQSVYGLFVHKWHEAIAIMKISLLAEGICSFLEHCKNFVLIATTLADWYHHQNNTSTKCCCTMIRNTKFTKGGFKKCCKNREVRTSWPTDKTTCMWMQLNVSNHIFKLLALVTQDVKYAKL